MSSERIKECYRIVDRGFSERDWLQSAAAVGTIAPHKLHQVASDVMRMKFCHVWDMDEEKTEITDAEIEAGARALRDSERVHVSVWEDIGVQSQDNYRQAAKVVLEAARDARRK